MRTRLVALFVLLSLPVACSWKTSPVVIDETQTPDGGGASSGAGAGSSGGAGTFDGGGPARSGEDDAGPGEVTDASASDAAADAVVVVQPAHDSAPACARQSSLDDNCSGFQLTPQAFLCDSADAGAALMPTCVAMPNATNTSALCCP